MVVSESIVYFVILIPLLVFAIVLSKGKGASLLAGYNTLSESKKQDYDEVALCQFMGKIMYGVCFSILLIAGSELFEYQSLFSLGVMLLFILIVFAVVYSNTNDRFKKKR
ncbi:DUF3784 domain-containing protein [Exiguobacterium sp. TBG-PICH-001]|uniref:DUF3784 domain-containing protein n=1 Tax=Exiguobacterium abrahamii TaxID=2785532 RepID=UPI0018A79779|nr:DUF3784 domain-containing protein [Exiguobacterium sp. TBG-PICH-001]MBF8153030.1 DUF3784 domain-containing protein [Exiguobacterium sp. TBG-PICH-001]